MNEIIGRHVKIADQGSPLKNQYGKIVDRDRKYNRMYFIVQIDAAPGIPGTKSTQEVFSIDQ